MFLFLCSSWPTTNTCKLFLPFIICFFFFVFFLWFYLFSFTLPCTLREYSINAPPHFYTNIPSSKSTIKFSGTGSGKTCTITNIFLFLLYIFIFFYPIYINILWTSLFWHFNNIQISFGRLLYYFIYIYIYTLDIN